MKKDLKKNKKNKINISFKCYNCLTIHTSFIKAITIILLITFS